MEFGYEISFYAVAVLAIGGLINVHLSIANNKSDTKENKAVVDTQINFISKQLDAMKKDICKNSTGDKNLERRVDEIAQAIVVLQVEVKQLSK